jgi:coenzyme F420-reducing hydrogenase gamma subunit
MAKRRPKLAVWKFASCDGCQLSLLDCEDELLEIAQAFDIAYFAELSRARGKPPYDVSIIEGSITTADDAARIQVIRRQSRWLVAVGACATAGGIQALRNFGDVRELCAASYPRPEAVTALARSSAMAEHVRVDFELQGCPPNKEQLLDLLCAYNVGRAPLAPQHSLCLECKRAGVVCVLVAHGTPCLGPVTDTGCGVLCPSHARGCYGCFGPKEVTNTTSLRRIFASLGAKPSDVALAFRTYYAGNAVFREASERATSGDEGRDA